MKRFGAVPLVRALPPTVWAEGRTGAQPKSFLQRFRRGEAAPHIRRRSRGEQYASSFVLDSVFKTVSHIGRRSRGEQYTSSFVLDSVQDGFSHQAAKPRRAIRELVCTR